jgi:hypothetical protein
MTTPEHYAQPTTVTPPHEMTPDLPPVTPTHQRQPYSGRFHPPTMLGPYEGFALGVSGRVRRSPKG